MLRSILLVTGSLVVLGVAPAMAQDANQSGSSSSGSTQNANQGSGGANMPQGAGGADMPMKASDITCREINALDTQRVAGVLYFISGYTEGERSAMGGSADTASAGSGNGTPGAASTDTASNSSDQSGDASSSATTDQTASASGGASQSGDMSNQSGDTTGSTQSSGKTAVITAVPGYYEIPVEQTLVACSSEPDSKASDVMNRQKGASGSAGSGSSNAQ